MRTPRGDSASDLAVDADGSRLQPLKVLLFWTYTNAVELIKMIPYPDVIAKVIRHDSHGKDIKIQCPIAVKKMQSIYGEVDLADGLRKTNTSSK